MMRRRNGPVTQPGSGVEIASDCTHQQWDLSSWKCDYSRAVPGKRGPECAAVDSSEVPLLINSGTAALLVFDQALDTSRDWFWTTWRPCRTSNRSRCPPTHTPIANLCSPHASTSLCSPGACLLSSCPLLDMLGSSPPGSSPASNTSAVRTTCPFVASLSAIKRQSVGGQTVVPHQAVLREQERKESSQTQPLFRCICFRTSRPGFTRAAGSCTASSHAAGDVKRLIFHLRSHTTESMKISFSFMLEEFAKHENQVFVCQCCREEKCENQHGFLKNGK